ncbi:unnamed protein product, partial [Phaeothamnion confervicola]
VLSLPQVHALARSLPDTLCTRHWQLLYSLDAHGASLNTLLARCAGREPTLLALADRGGAVFGGFATGAPWSREQGEHFFGGGDSFVFSSLGWGGGRGGASPLGNTCFMFCDHRGIGMGGGPGGEFAIFLDDALCRGTSGPCQTFGNARLASSSPFECVALEMWGFVNAV